MRTQITLLSVLIAIFFSPLHFSNPDSNGNTPGCNACHTQQLGIVSVVANGLDVEITLSGTTDNVAGELVDQGGTVVAVNNSTSNNPFILTAPSEGTYLVNAGYNNPSRDWDSISVAIAVTGVGGETTDLLNTYKLYSNYPNPFNPSTKIKYLIAEKTFVSLKIYNIAGSEVASIVNREQSAGEYEVNFNAGNLTSGVYVYKLQAGNFVQTKKMILMK